MATRKVRFTLLDGSEIDFETTTFMAIADRIALERRYGHGVLSDEGLGEEQILFMMFRAGQRENPRLADMSFDDFCEVASTWEAPMDDDTPPTEDPPTP